MRGLSLLFLRLLLYVCLFVLAFAETPSPSLGVTKVDYSSLTGTWDYDPFCLGVSPLGRFRIMVPSLAAWLIPPVPPDILTEGRLPRHCHALLPRVTSDRACSRVPLLSAQLLP